MSVQIPPNSTGTVLDTNTISGKDRQIVNVGDPSTGANVLAVNSAGAAAVSGAAADGATLAGNPVLVAGSDGTNAKSIKTASAANISAASQNGTLAKPGQWGVTHTPSSAAQATITKAAGGAGVRHVATSIAFSLNVDGTNAQTAIQVNLRDGATGAGTILWSMTIKKQATEPATLFSITGLNIPGTANTAMTLEFSAAGVTGSVESVSLTGYDVS